AQLRCPAGLQPRRRAALRRARAVLAAGWGHRCRAGGGGVLSATAGSPPTAGRHGGALWNPTRLRWVPDLVSGPGRAAGTHAEVGGSGGELMVTRVERRTLTVAGEPLAAALLRPRTRIPGVLFIHGWGGSQQRDLERARGIAGL